MPGPSALAKPGGEYLRMVEEVQAEAEARRARLQERRRQAEEAPLSQPP